jgi:ribose 5-phosphate isomerase B
MAKERKLRIIAGADHRGYELKCEIVPWLRSMGYEVDDIGADSAEPVDYPEYAFRVGEAVGGGGFDRGLLLCHSGNGIAIAANKVRGVRAAICMNREHAEMSRRHNDANVLVIGTDYIRPGSEREIVTTWLESPFDGGRHARRVAQIEEYEAEHARGG